MNREICPTFFVHVNRVVEVTYTEWEEVGELNWRMVKGAELEVPSAWDRIIFELPIGCFELNCLSVFPAHVTLGPDSSNNYTSLNRCVVHPLTEEEESSLDEHQVLPSMVPRSRGPEATEGS